MSDERWQPIKGFESYYSVSTQGQVLSLRGGKLLKPRLVSKYLGVILQVDGILNSRYVHRLVAQTFIGECPQGLIINHKNGNKTDNSASNLEYVTPAENVRHALETGLFGSRKGELNGQAKLTQAQVDEIRLAYANGGTSCKKLGDRFGVSSSLIWLIVKGKKW